MNNSNIVQIQLPNDVPLRFPSFVTSFKRVYFHAPFNFSFKRKGDEWLEYLTRLQNEYIFRQTTFSFVVHYKNPFDEFIKDLKIYSSKYPVVNILFENPAEYALNEYQFDEILRNCNGLCLDTCHLFASGIHFIPFVKKYKKSIKLIHLNDSKGGFGSGLDRHENIFKGYLFKERKDNKILEYIFSFGIDMILETPNSEKDFKVLKSMFFTESKKSFSLGITVEMLFKNLNEPITRLLLEESDTLFGKENRYKKAALLRGSNIIGNLPFEIKNEEQLAGIKGIGEGIKSRVREYFLKLKKDGGISPSYSIKTSPHPPVQTTEQETSSKIPSHTIKNVFEPFFKKHFKRSIIAGSYRRGLKETGDIDLIVFDDIDFVVKTVGENFDIEKIISKGKKKCSLIVKLASASHQDSSPLRNRGEHAYQLDVIKTTIQSYPFALLYFTGNKYFNIQLRKVASQKGFKLNEYGLFRLSKKTAFSFSPSLFSTEKDIFSFLGLKYLKPSDRTFL